MPEFSIPTQKIDIDNNARFQYQVGYWFRLINASICGVAGQADTQFCFFDSFGSKKQYLIFFLSSITSEGILTFMSKVSDGTKQNTKKLRFTLLSAFFNYIKNSVEPDFQNPCDNPALRKPFQGREASPI